MLLASIGCKAQEKITVRYVNSKYEGSKNKSFITREMIFLKNEDTLIINIRLPFDISNPKIFNPGIYYNCHLRKDSVYTISLKRICANDIPKDYNSYYKTNIVPDEKDCSRFKEIDKNTDYEYRGYYGMYVDMKGTLYEIIKLTPDDGCVFPP